MVEQRAIDGAGHEDVVDRATQHLAGGSDVVEGELKRLEVAPPRAVDPQRRAALDVAAAADLVGQGAQRLHRLLADVLDADRIRAPQRHLAGRPPGDACLAAPGVADRAAGHVREAGGEVAALLLVLGRLLGERLGDDVVDVDVGRQRRVGVPLHVELGEPDQALAVGDGVVDLAEQRPAAALEPVEHHEHPERTGSIEGILVEAGRQLVELARGARRRQAEVANVVADVELGVGRPQRRRQPPQPGHDPLAQTRDLGDGPAHAVAELLDVHGPVEHADHPAVGVQPRVPLDVPHERLGVRHPALEAHLAPLAHHVSHSRGPRRRRRRPRQGDRWCARPGAGRKRRDVRRRRRPRWSGAPGGGRT